MCHLHLYGEINIDARLLEKDGIMMRELSNGSIFCSCIKENFIKALIDMSSHEFEYLFIEASGLADPGNMQQILQVIEKYTVHSYDYSGSICVLDGEAFLELNTLLPAVQNQVAHAGVVLVNKEDLISSTIKAEIQAEVRNANIVWGIGVTIAIYTARHLSCAHLNPAVTLTMVASKKMLIKKLPVYLLAQFLGAFFAGLVLYLFFNPSIVVYQNIHHIISGTADSMHTAKIFGEYYQFPGSNAAVSMPIAFLAEAFGTFQNTNIFLATDVCLHVAIYSA